MPSPNCSLLTPFNKLDRASPRSDSAGIDRAFALLLSGRTKAAVEQFKTSAHTWRRLKPDPALMAAGYGEIVPELEAYAQTLPGSPLAEIQSVIAHMYLGSVTPDQVLARASWSLPYRRKADLMLAHLHVGLWKRQHGDENRAREHFRQAAAQNVPLYYESELAKYLAKVPASAAK